MRSGYTIELLYVLQMTFIHFYHDTKEKERYTIRDLVITLFERHSVGIRIPGGVYGVWMGGGRCD